MFKVCKISLLSHIVQHSGQNPQANYHKQFGHSDILKRKKKHALPPFTKLFSQSHITNYQPVVNNKYPTKKLTIRSHATNKVGGSHVDASNRRRTQAFAQKCGSAKHFDMCVEKLGKVVRRKKKKSTKSQVCEKGGCARVFIPGWVKKKIKNKALQCLPELGK